MSEEQVGVIRTVITPQGYARAVITAWKHVGEGIPEKQAVAVLYAQWMMETGGSACWNWNIGNAKHFAGDGFNYMCLNGVWEGVDPVTAGNLIAAGRAIRDPSPDHAKAVGVGRVSVIFPPPQPESRFRAFPDLATGMAQHLKLLHMRFAAAWPWILGGNSKGTAQALKTHGYFTADAGVYGAGMQGHFAAFMKTSAYDLALESVQETMEAETQPELDAPPSEPNAASQPTIHVDPSSFLRPEEWAKDPDDVD